MSDQNIGLTTFMETLSGLPTPSQKIIKALEKIPFEGIKTLEELQKVVSLGMEYTSTYFVSELDLVKTSRLSNSLKFFSDPNDIEGDFV